MSLDMLGYHSPGCRMFLHDRSKDLLAVWNTEPMTLLGQVVKSSKYSGYLLVDR